MEQLAPPGAEDADVDAVRAEGLRSPGTVHVTRNVRATPAVNGWASQYRWTTLRPAPS